MSDLRESVSPVTHAVLDIVEELAAHPVWGKAGAGELLAEIDLWSDTVFGVAFKRGADGSKVSGVQLTAQEAAAAGHPALLRLAAFCIHAATREAARREAAAALHAFVEQNAPAFQPVTVPAFLQVGDVPFADGGKL